MAGRPPSDNPSIPKNVTVKLKMYTEFVELQEGLPPEKKFKLSAAMARGMQSIIDDLKGNPDTIDWPIKAKIKIETLARLLQEKCDENEKLRDIIGKYVGRKEDQTTKYDTKLTSKLDQEQPQNYDE